MSVNPCKNGDREKDQNNNFVNSVAHGGAGVDRERRARQATARAGLSTRGSDDGVLNQLRSNGARANQNSHYYHSQQQQPKDCHHGPSAVTGGGGGCGGGGGTGGTGAVAGPQVTAKVMWGNVSAIKELRDKEQNERHLGTRASARRQ